jgi:hypothetical protein
VKNKLSNVYIITKQVTKDLNISSQFTSKLMRFLSLLHIEDSKQESLFLDELRSIIKENRKDEVLFGEDRNQTLLRMKELFQPVMNKYNLIIV